MVFSDVRKGKGEFWLFLVSLANGRTDLGCICNAWFVSRIYDSNHIGSDFGGTAVVFWLSKASWVPCLPVASAGFTFCHVTVIYVGDQLKVTFECAHSLPSKK